MRTLTVAMMCSVVTVSAGIAPAMVQAASPTLDGTRWSIKVTPEETSKKAGGKAFSDTLVFRGGRLASKASAKHGFANAAYTATELGTADSFQASQSSKRNGKAVWSGQVAGTWIKGTLTWTKKNGNVLRYHFEGRKAKAT